MKHYTLLIAVVSVLTSCEKPVASLSFYYWRTQFEPSSTEMNVLKDLHVKKLYVRFFDVDISKQWRQAIPVGILELKKEFPETSSVIPVVFITNRTFLNLKEEEVPELAGNVVKKINGIKGNYQELQIDCDWSVQTKKKYFSFLEQVKKEIASSIVLTATIRLHQVKYASITGVPPVDRGTLMFYNMGDLSNGNEKNSIYDPRNAEKYIAQLGNYELPLDAALPVFSWYVHYRNNAVKGLITKKQIPDLLDPVHFTRTEKSATFMARSSFFENGIYFKEGDLLKPERLSDEELKDAARLLQKHLKTEKRTIIFYDLDEINLMNYDETIFKDILAIFN